MFFSLHLSPLLSSVPASLLAGLGSVAHCSYSLQSHKARGLFLSSTHICAPNPPKRTLALNEHLNSSPMLEVGESGGGAVS